jgi:hypothetical protein
MNNKRQKSNKTPAATCLCEGAGPVLSDLLRRLGPPEEARRHFEAARVEVLRGLRALIDARLEYLSKRSRAAGKGEKIDVQ